MDRDNRPWGTTDIFKAFDLAKVTPTDMQQHCTQLMILAASSDVVVEFGCRRGVSTVCFLAGKPGFVCSYDLEHRPHHDEIREMVPAGSEWQIVYGDILQTTVDTPPPPCDMMFFDSEHSYQQVKYELQFAYLARKYLVFHDTSTFWHKNPHTGQRGIGPAIEEFLAEHPEWKLVYKTSACHGLQVYERCE